jgi:hypothetical protein
MFGVMHLRAVSDSDDNARAMTSDAQSADQVEPVDAQLPGQGVLPVGRNWCTDVFDCVVFFRS